MSATNAFDRYFLNLPPFDKEKDFDRFWNRSIKSLERIPIEPVIEKNDNESSGNFDFFDITFKGAGRSPVRGGLYIPKNIKKPKLILSLPDYNQTHNPLNNASDSDLAYFFLNLRGHELINNNKQKDDKKSPGYMSENILDKNLYYVKSIYLDAYRSIDMLRLTNRLDCSSIGIFGKGLGASAAVFTASFSDRVAAIVLDSPSFCYHELSQNISTSDASNEINDFLTNYKSEKDIIKKNLSYFDSVNFSDKIKCPVLLTIGLKDSISPPECAFGLFNHFHCEKTVEVYPDDGNSAGGKTQKEKSVEWLKGFLG